MLRAIREHARVQPGGLLELRHPELSVGVEVEIVIMVEAEPPYAPEKPPTLASLVGRGSGCFANAAEVDSFVRAEREAWDR